MHFDERREANRVAKIVFIAPRVIEGHAAALDCHDAQFFALAADFIGQERKCQSCEIAAAADASDQHIRFDSDSVKLRLRFLSDNRLVQQNRVEHAAERVTGVVVVDGVLDRFADGDAERTERVGVLRQNFCARLGFIRRRGKHFAAP
jgi:hypothetical protein